MEGRFELSGAKTSQRYSFSDGEARGNVPAGSTMKDGNGQSATPVSDASSVNEYDIHHHILKPTPPLSTQPSTSATTSSTPSKVFGGFFFCVLFIFHTTSLGTRLLFHFFLKSNGLRIALQRCMELFCSYFHLYFNIFS